MHRRGEIERIRSTVLLLDDTPDSSQSLARCKLIRKRRRQTLPTQLPAATLSKFKNWVLDPSSSMVLAQGQGIRSSSFDFAVDFLDAILDRKCPVIWALPVNNERGQPTISITGILRSLISQLLELECVLAPNGMNLLPLRQFQDITSIRHWFQLLERCIALFPRLFIVIDTSLVQRSLEDEASNHEYFTLGQFMTGLSDIVARRDKNGLKIVIASWRFDTAASMEASEVFSEKQFATDMGLWVQRLMRQPKYRVMIGKRDQGFSQKLRLPGDELP